MPEGIEGGPDTRSGRQGIMDARTEWLVAQSLLGRRRARGAASRPVFPPAATAEEVAARTALLLAGSHLARTTARLREAA